MLFFADRHRRAGRYLEWKVWIFTVAAGFTLVGLYFEDRRLTGVAIGLLICAVLLRFLPGGVGQRPDEGEDDGDVLGDEDHEDDRGEQDEMDREGARSS